MEEQLAAVGASIKRVDDAHLPADVIMPAAMA
jgi:hypothetical protein